MLLRRARYIFTVVIILTFLYPQPIGAFSISCNIQPQKKFPQNLQEIFQKDFCRMSTEVFHLNLKTGLCLSSNKWTYDNIDQLTQATHPALPEENFTYDPLGNRNPLTHTYDIANRLLSDGRYTYTYDANGNRIAKEDIDTGEIITYTYNAENQLITINYPLSTINYFYDGLGRRIEKNVNGTITRYIYDDMDILAEFNGANELIRNYVHGPSIDEPLELTTGPTTYYYITDGLGSITAIIDGSGNIVEQYRYDSFGNTTIQNAAGEEIPESVYGNRYMFTAREYDTETGLYYYRLRYYDPLVGRFLQEDPVGYLLGPNLYTYVHNNPVNLVDPLGLAWRYRRPLDSSFARGIAGGIYGDYAGGPIQHQGYVYEDGRTSGYYGNSTVGRDTGSREVMRQMETYGPKLDDRLLEQAEQNIINNWDQNTNPNAPGYDARILPLLDLWNHHDCQDYADAVFEEYLRLLEQERANANKEN